MDIRLGLRLLREQRRRLLRINPSARRWPMPLAAALSSSMPLWVGAVIGRPDWGAAAALGGLAFLYLPEGPFAQRLSRLLACAASLWLCFAIGLAVRSFPALVVPALLLTAGAASAACQRFAVQPPSSVFFLMAMAVAVYAPIPAHELEAQAIAHALGSAWACAIGLVYSLAQRQSGLIQSVPTTAASRTWGDGLADAAVIAACVGLASWLAEWHQLNRPYWVPVSCLAVMQGLTLRAIWDRQLHRLAGTTLGLGLAGAVLALELTPWTLPLAVLLFAFTTEMLIVRHYGLGVVFVTPLAILMSEAATPLMQAPGAVMQARLIDTALGGLVGLFGGWCQHRWRSLQSH